MAPPIVCTKCGCGDVRRSKHTKWIDYLRLLLRQRALRCRTCSARFYARSGPAIAAVRISERSRKVDARRGRKHVRRWFVEAIIFAILLLLFWIFLNHLTREPAPSDSNGRRGQAIQLVEVEPSPDGGHRTNRGADENGRWIFDQQ